MPGIDTASGPAGQWRLFAVAAPGLEPLVAKELGDLGIPAGIPVGIPQGAARPPIRENLADGQSIKESVPGAGSGGVEFPGSLEDVYRANLHLRTASRVLVRLGDFYAVGFPELRKKAGRLAWENYLSPGQPVEMHVTCHKSKLYHSGAVAERVLAAITDRLGKPSPAVKAATTGEEYEGSAQQGGAQRREPAARQEAGSAQMVVVRLVHDHCIISVDSSGELLHRRGYRLATAKAPLRETIAAAILLAAGWDDASLLVDPFCGSGTIAIEAAMLARKIAPGGKRKFAFMNWPGYNPSRWKTLLAESLNRTSAECPPIQASDRDAGAIQLALANAERAGVAANIQFDCRAVSAIDPPGGPGWVVTNPPYGIRVSPSKDLRNLYAQLGHVLRAHCPGWQVAILCSDLMLLGQIGLRLDTSFMTVNGGVNVRLARGTVS